MFQEKHLPQELDDGNIEYKRCLINIELHRIEEYITQMKWRLSEGDGEAIYYIGIEDDGSFYEWSENDKNDSLKMMKKIVSKANLKISKLEKIKYNLNTDKVNEYFKITIREKEKILIEKRILLLGPSGVGKSTFLANIILSKIDEENKEARLYLMNHQHELISKKTSSFNYLYLIHKDIKWVFIEAPGDDKYNKTRNKIILSFGSSIDCCLIMENGIWNKKEYYVKYLKAIGIPYININLYEANKIYFPNYNTKTIIDKDDFFKNIFKLCLTKKIKKRNNTEFIILQSFFNNHLGVVLTGILKSGELNINNTFYLHLNDIYKIKINSIHLDGKPLNKINGPRTVSICIDALKETDSLDYIGVISNTKLNKIDNFKIEFNNVKNSILYKDNKIMNYMNYKNYYQTNDKIFLVNDGIGFNN